MSDPKGGAAGGALNLLQFEGLNHKCEIRSGVKAEECRDLLRDFFSKTESGSGCRRKIKPSSRWPLGPGVEIVKEGPAGPLCTE